VRLRAISPEGEYEQTWQASRDLTVVSSALMSESQAVDYVQGILHDSSV
jgi:hypothetical protein